MMSKLQYWKDKIYHMRYCPETLTYKAYRKGRNRCPICGARKETK